MSRGTRRVASRARYVFFHFLKTLLMPFYIEINFLRVPQCTDRHFRTQRQQQGIETTASDRDASDASRD
jgi:hypothetical protein